MARLKLTLASSGYDHIRDFTGGEIKAEGIELNYLHLPIEGTFFRFINFREWDVSEMSSGKYISLISQGDDSMVGLPIFPSRVHRQSSLYVRPGSPLKTGADLRGKRIGLPEWGQSASVYTRGWLQHDMGVPLAEIDWVQAGVNMPGRVEKVKLKLPKGVKIEPSPERSLSDLLLAGDIDCIMTAHAPQLFEDGSPEIVRLYPNYREVEEDYFRKTRIWPIMHLYCMRRELFEEHPWVAMNLYRAFDEAKNRSLKRAVEITASRFPIAWCYDAGERARELMGDDFFPYGIEPNRPTLEAFTQYAFEQGLAHRKVSVEELFPANVQKAFKV